MIRLTIPSIEEDDLAAMREALASGFLVQGARVRAFEARVAELAGTKHAVAVSSGTAALHLALLALDTRPSDLVVTTAYSWISTANAAEFCGAQPVFVDIRRDTFNMDPDALRAVLARLGANSETLRRVKAILPIHAFGQMADMPEILESARDYGIPVVEDAACALGATLDQKQAGAWGEIGTFSFHPRKAVTTGEGGLVVTGNDRLAWKLRALRNHGQDPDSQTPDFVMPGYNYRMTEFQAALGMTQLCKLTRILARRKEAAARYGNLLAGTAVTSPAVGRGSTPVYQSYVCLLPAEAARRRSEIIARLRERGIETSIGTWHVPMTTYFRTRYSFQTGDFPATDEVFVRALTLPLYEQLTLEEQEFVVQALLAEVA
jgi:dTDP-4-amino-4,6-dideoxygalactose transaminase